MIKRIFTLAALLTSAGCWGEHHNPLSEVNIHASHDVQVAVVDATKRFGEQNGFQVYATDNLPREGRLVSQVLLTRSDGVTISASNFMDEGAIKADFFAEKQGADWRPMKEKWLREIRAVVGKEGNVVDVILEEEPLKK